MQAIDLHVHSTRSDGTYSPTELVDYAIEKGLKAFALTDHDTVDGLSEAIEYAKKIQAPLEVIPGIELSTEYEGRDIHIVGLYIDFTNKDFKKYLQDFIDSRTTRNQKMCRLLSQEAGIDITYEKLLETFPNSVITRTHYAKYMLMHGYIKSISEAFERYIGDRCKYFIPREKVTPVQGVQLILNAGGIPVLAHPILYHMSDAKLDSLVAELKAAGLMGIEAIYSTYTPRDERWIRGLAGKYNLFVSGGSDFHGANKPGLDLAVGYGKLFVPCTILKDLEQCMKKALFTDLDGTLLLNDSTVSDEMHDALENMCKKGHKLILTSGRPLPSILEIAKKYKLDFPGTLIIANNGSVVYDIDKAEYLYETGLTVEDINFIEEKAQEFGLHIHSFTRDSIVTHGMDAEIELYTGRIHMPVLVTDRFEKLLPKGSYKILAVSIDDRPKLERFQKMINTTCRGRISAVFSSNVYLEILPPTVSKGAAIKKVAGLLNISLNNTYAAGDEENDISMIKAARHGIAMQNARDSVKAAADIVTQKTNDENGLLEIILKL